MTYARHIGEALRNARKKLELTEEACALACGLSDSCYADVELDDAEFFMNISLGTARRICRFLHLDLLALTSQYLSPDLLPVPHRKLIIGDCLPATDAQFYGRHHLILDTRLAKGMTDEDLADAIGFEVITVRELEQTPDYVETLPINVVVMTAIVLDLDPGQLLCNRAV